MLSTSSMYGVCTLLRTLQYSTVFDIDTLHFFLYTLYSVFAFQPDKMPHSSPHPQFIKSPSKTRWFSFMRTTPTLPWLVPNTNHAPLGPHPPYRWWLIGYGPVGPWIMSGSALNNDNDKGCVLLWGWCGGFWSSDIVNNGGALIGFIISSIRIAYHLTDS